jgi:hypothetical protein
MPVVQGTVDRIFVNPTFCCITLRTAPTEQKLMLLWSYLAQEDNASNRLLHGSYLSLVREALVHDGRVELFHAAGSALVDSVTLTE